MQSLRLVFRYLIRQPRRAILTMLTFAVATFIFTVLAAIPSSIDMILKKTAETLRVYSYNADGRYLGVPARDCRTVEQIPGVVACMPMVVLRATYQNASETVQAFALDADKVALMYPDYNLPAEVLEQFNNNRSAAVAGRLLMRKHGWKVGDVVTLRGDSNRLDIKFTMVGEIPADNYPNFFMFRRDYLVEAEKRIGIPEEKHPAGFLVTRVDTASHVPSVIHEIDRGFHNSDFETASMTESEAVSGLMSTVGDVREIVSAISAVIALTIFLIAANAMSMMVRERLRDVAVLRALGFSQPYIARILFGECALIGAVGGGFGCALALWQFGSGETLRAVLESAGYLTVTYDAALEALTRRNRDQPAECRDSGVGRDARDTGRRLSQDNLSWLPADGVTNRVEYIDEVAGGVITVYHPNRVRRRTQSPRALDSIPSIVIGILLAGLTLSVTRLLSNSVHQLQRRTADDVHCVLSTFDRQGPGSGRVERRTLTQSGQTECRPERKWIHLLRLLCSALPVIGVQLKVRGEMRRAANRRFVDVLCHFRCGHEGSVGSVLDVRGR